MHDVALLDAPGKSFGIASFLNRITLERAVRNVRHHQDRFHAVCHKKNVTPDPYLLDAPIDNIQNKERHQEVA